VNNDKHAAEVERLAREAGMTQDGDCWFSFDAGDCDVTSHALARFAALVRAQALEDAAKVCESRQTPGTGSVAILNGAAEAIRALKDAP
jgi:hypothetical protein